jgi:hypothetical protein
MRLSGEKNIVEPHRPQTAIWRMRIASWITMFTNTHSWNLILIAIPLQKMVARTRLSVRLYTLCLYCCTCNFLPWLCSLQNTGWSKIFCAPDDYNTERQVQRDFFITLYYLHFNNYDCTDSSKYCGYVNKLNGKKKFSCQSGSKINFQIQQHLCTYLHDVTCQKKSLSWSSPHLTVSLLLYCL